MERRVEGGVVFHVMGTGLVPPRLGAGLLTIQLRFSGCAVRDLARAIRGL